MVVCGTREIKIIDTGGDKYEEISDLSVKLPVSAQIRSVSWTKDAQVCLCVRNIVSLLFYSHRLEFV